MAAKAKFVRNEWAVFFNQHNTRWYKAQPDRTTALAVEKEANRRIAAGEDLRPPDKRPSQQPAAPKPRVTGLTLRAFASRWLVEEAPTRKATTNDYYETQLRVHIFPAIGDLPIAEIDRGVVKQLLRDLIGKVSERTGRKLRNMTREAVHAALCAVLEAAVDQQLIQFNPALRLRKKHMHDPDQLEEDIQVWSPAEAARFLKACQAHYPRWYPFFLTALRTGPRIGELAELRWEKDFKHASQLHIQRSYSFRRRQKLVLNPDGSYRRERIADQDRITTTKGKKRRLIDLPVEVEQVLKAHRASQREWCFKRGKSQSLTFTSDKGMRVSDVTLARLMRKIERLAEVPRLTIHGLRHTYASVNLSRHVPLKEVSEQLGHADVATTERHYKHFIPDDADAVERRRKRQAEVWNVVGESAEGSK